MYHSMEDLPQLEEIARAKIANIITVTDFFSQTYVVLVLSSWLEIDPDKAKEWLENAFRNISNVLEFARNFVEYTHDNLPRIFLKPRINN